MTTNRVFSLFLLAMTGAAGFLWAQAPEPAPEAAPSPSTTTEPAATAPETTTAPAPSAAPAPLQPLQQDPQMLTGQLENGLSYIIRPTREPKGRASMRLYVDTGSLNETEELSGVSHFLEHLVFNGSRHFKRGELIPAMQKLGLGFGGDANAYTSLLQTVYMLDLPNLKDETVDFALMILRDFADGATLEDDAIDHERGIVVSELKARDSESYRATVQLMKQYLRGTRTPDFMPIGREEVIQNVSYQAVRDYYHQNYLPGRMTLVITGDVAAEQAEAWVKKHFGAMEKRETPPRPALGQLSHLGADETLISNAEQAKTSVLMAVVNPWQKKADTLEQRIEDLPLELACAMLNRRFSRLSKQESSPFLQASADKSGMFRTGEVFSLGVTSDPARWEDGMTRALDELRQVMTHGFRQEEFQEIVTGLMTNLQQSCDTWETVTAEAMADKIVDSLQEETLPTAPAEDMRAVRLGLERLRNDPELCRQALVKAFETERIKLTMMGTLPKGVTNATLREAFNRAMQREVQKPTEQKIRPFAYETIGQPGTVTQQATLEDLGVMTLTLSNGVKVNLKPVDFRKGSISVLAAVDGGTLRLPATPGLTLMTNSVMSGGGLEAHSMDELQQLLTDQNVSLDFSLSPTRFLFSGETNGKDLEMQCKLLAAAILHPGFRPEGETVLRRRLDAFYKRLETTPAGAYSMQAPRLLFGDDARFTIPRREEIEALTREDVRRALAPYLKDGAMEVTIVGDFKVEEILPVLERTFGAMPQRNASFAPLPDAAREVSFRPWGQREFLKYPTELDKTIVSHVRPAGNGRDHRRNRRLAVLSAIVREKLFDGLRAAMGESYSPRVQLAFHSEMNNAAYITASSAGVKGNRTKVSAAMDSICSGIGQGNISEEDFECAIRPYRSSLEKALRSTGFWLDQLSELQSDSEKLPLLRQLMPDVESITLEEIRALAKEVFGKDNANFYFTVPEDTELPEATPQNEEKQNEEQRNDEKQKQAPLHLGSPYAVILSEATAAEPAWKKVAETLVSKYDNAHLVVLPQLTENACAEALRQVGARYAAYVMRPCEVTREAVNHFHRAARKVDADPWGDCIWGIVTGHGAADAQRIAEAREPLVIKRLLGTTNVSSERFESSYCITDWEGFPVLEQEGYQKPKKTTYSIETPEGEDILTNGIQGKFAHRLATARPQLLITSSHATQFNLEMPFSKGLIFPAGNRFYQVPAKQFSAFANALRPAMLGKTEALATLAEVMQFEPIQPDGETRVWLAAGNCLLGDAAGSAESMVITALSAYGCNQFVGYTVPSWYGAGGWGTLSCFFDNTDGTTLAEAWFLNNQFLLAQTQEIDPRLLQAEFNEPAIGPGLERSLRESQARPAPEHLQDAVGLVHDRDTVAFYGDPAWSATLDDSHAQSPYRVEWHNAGSFTITANRNHKGRCAIWFPTAETGKQTSGCDDKEAIYTNDFILFPHLEMKKGESRTVTLH